MKTYPNYPQFILVSEFSGRGQYQNVNVAHIDYEQTTAERPVYKLNDNQTPVPVPHLAPENKDWQWLGDKWLLIDDYANMPVYSKASGQRIAPPLFGEALTDDMTLKTPPSESGKITYFDAKANDWAMREDLSGKQVFSTTDPSQSLVLGREDWAVPDGYTETPAPSPAHVWDAKKSAWLLDKAKQAELDKQATLAAGQARLVEIEQAIQSHINQTVAGLGMGFTDDQSLIGKYAGYDNVFRPVAEAVGKWVAEIWYLAAQDKAAIMTGQKAIPSVAEALTKIPPLVLPSTAETGVK